MILQDSAGSEDFGRRLAGLVVPGDVITLAGPLGAGKTSIARGLLAALGLSEEAPSALIVEWPERAPGYWPEALALSLEILSNGTRALTARVPAAWKARWQQI